MNEQSRASVTSPSISDRSIRPRTACCVWCWSSTAKSSPASIRISACLHRGTEKLIETQDLSAGDPVFRPARLCRADESGARLLPGGGKAARHRGAAPRAVDPGALLRDRPHPVASAQRHHAGDGRRRADAAAVGLRRARKADGVLRARLRLAHARGLFPHRRRAPGPAAEADRRYRGLVRSVPAAWSTISTGC